MAAPAAGVGQSVSLSHADMIRGEHPGTTCSLCHKGPILGPRFQCLHCPTTAVGPFNVCIKCEPQIHGNVVAGGGAAAAQHNTSHAFQILEPEHVMSASEWAERRLELGAGGEGGSQADGHCILQ